MGGCGLCVGGWGCVCVYVCVHVHACMGACVRVSTYCRPPLQEVASEVVKLLKDMIKGGLGAQWEGYAKSAVGQAILHLTKVPEEVRVPEPGMYSQTVRC